MSAKPVFLVVEDGDEYVRRFTRFLGASFDFVRAGGFREALARLAELPAYAGLLLDLDFRRTAAAELVDERGQLLGARASTPPSSAVAPSPLHAMQGILLLQALRQRGVRLPAWLFADLDDAAQVSYLETTLAPLWVLSSAVGLPEVAALLRATAARTPGAS